MRRESLPWDWAQKTADFCKPGDKVLTLTPGFDLSAVPAESVQVALSRGPIWGPAEISRLLCPGGFFLMECEGGEDSRELANFLVPGARPGNTENLENQLPLWRGAGFRVMFRDQAYPVTQFDSLDELLRYIALFPEKFPGFSKEACADRLQKLQERLTAYGFLENREHRFILIVKKKG